MQSDRLKPDTNLGRGLEFKILPGVIPFSHTDAKQELSRQLADRFPANESPKLIAGYSGGGKNRDAVSGTGCTIDT